MTPPDAGIGKSVVHSSAWLYGRRLLASFFSLFVTALLSRKLPPADFGTVALAAVILNLLTTVGPAGIKGFIVYDRQEGREERVHAAFWLGVVITLAATAFCLVLAPLVVHYYGTPALGPILNALVLQFALSQISIIPEALLQRVLDFKKLVLRDSVLQIITGGAMIAMAYTGYGIWSLIVPPLVATPFRVMLTFKLARWIPTFPLRTRSWPQIFRYTFHTTGAGFVSYLANEGDTLLIGKTLGSSELGLYNRAWGSANLVSNNVTQVVAAVAMPALSAVSDDAARLRAAMSRMLRMLGLASFPLLIGLLLVADLFVLTLYGPQWTLSVVPLQILIIYALRQTVGSPSAVIYQVVGRPDIGFKMGLLFLPFYFLSIWLGSFYGIIGVAAGVTVARTVYGIIQFGFVARLLGETFWELVSPMGQPLAAACIMGGVVALGRMLLDSFQLPAAAELGILALLGGAAWLALLARFFPALLEEGMTVTDHLPSAISVAVRRLLKPLLACLP
jgi:O-antigen/teichoic acid export membrane protein